MKPGASSAFYIGGREQKVIVSPPLIWNETLPVYGSAIEMRVLDADCSAILKIDASRPAALITARVSEKLVARKPLAHHDALHRSPSVEVAGSPRASNTMLRASAARVMFS